MAPIQALQSPEEKPPKVAFGDNDLPGNGVGVLFASRASLFCLFFFSAFLESWLLLDFSKGYIIES